MATRALEIAGPRRSACRQALENVPIHVFFIVAGVLWALPAIGLLVTSLRPVGLFTVTGWWTISTGTGGQVGINNYRHLFDSPLLAGSFVNSILIAVPATIIPVLFATLSAYAFTWLNFPGKTIFFLLLIALMVVPLQMALIPVAQLYGFIGPPGIVKVFLFHAAFALPYATFLFRNFFLGIPHELLESGRMDGANDWRIFRTIILPLAYPAIASFAVFQHLWDQPPAFAHGMIGRLDLEWVHFLMTLAIALVAVFLITRWPANPACWLLMPLALWHLAEHSVILTAYLRTGITGTSGILAKGGLLNGPVARPDLHFLYNAGVLVLLVGVWA